MQKKRENDILKNYLDILLLSPLPPPIGGIATWTNLYIEEQQKEKNNVDLVNTAKTNTNIVVFKILSEIYRNIKIIIKTLIKTSKKKYDIIHINSSCSKKGMIREWIIAKLCYKKTSIVFECHCDVCNYIKDKISIKIFNSICQNVDLVFCLNSQSKEYVEKNFCKNVVLVSNFLDESQIGNLCNPINKEVKKILYVGRITKDKGCNEIIEVSKFFPNIQFIFAGKLESDFSKENFNKNNIKYLGIKNKVQIYNLMSECDLLIFPSYSEGFPLAILEAMFVGIPIISTNVGSIHDLLEEDGTIYMKAGNIESVKSAINKMQDYELRKNTSLKNKHKAFTGYTIKKSVCELNNYYLGVKR